MKKDEETNEVIKKALEDMEKGYMVEPIRKIIKERAIERLFKFNDPLPDSGDRDAKSK